MKTCTTCKKQKPVSDFNKRALSSDGYKSYCRECQRNMSNNYYHNGKGKSNKQDYYIKHRDQLLPKLRLKGGKQKYNPEKAPARIAVYRAVKSGKLSKPAICSECGISCTPQAHHKNGYSKDHYLDIDWLCRNCHEKADNKEFYKKMEKR